MEKKLTAMMQLREILNKEDSRILNDRDYNKGWNDAIDLVLVKINLSMLPIEREQKKQCAIELEHDFDPTQAKNIAE